MTTKDIELAKQNKHVLNQLRALDKFINMTTTKPLYLLIKLDVDGEVVFTYEEAEKYAQNFCNSLEFELIDHCLEEEENPCLYIGGEEDNK